MNPEDEDWYRSCLDAMVAPPPPPRRPPEKKIIRKKAKTYTLYDSATRKTVKRVRK